MRLPSVSDSKTVIGCVIVFKTIVKGWNPTVVLSFSNETTVNIFRLMKKGVC